MSVPTVSETTGSQAPRGNLTPDGAAVGVAQVCDFGVCHSLTGISSALYTLLCCLDKCIVQFQAISNDIASLQYP